MRDLIQEEISEISGAAEMMGYTKRDMDEFGGLGGGLSGGGGGGGGGGFFDPGDNGRSCFNDVVRDAGNWAIGGAVAGAATGAGAALGALGGAVAGGMGAFSSSSNCEGSR